MNLLRVYAKLFFSSSARVSAEFKGAGIQLVVHALFLQQFFVIAAFDDAAAVQDQYLVGVFDGGQSMGNDEDGAAFHQGIHAPLDDLFGTGIDGAGGFVQDHDGGIGYSGSGDGQQLALALGEDGAAAFEQGIIALASI